MGVTKKETRNLKYLLHPLDKRFRVECRLNYCGTTGGSIDKKEEEEEKVNAHPCCFRLVHGGWCTPLLCQRQQTIAVHRLRFVAY